MTPEETRANRARKSVHILLAVALAVGVVVVVASVAIPMFSARLLRSYHDMPTPDLTVKVTGNQWNWSYEYPDQQIGKFTSVMLSEEAAKAKGAPFRLAADQALVVPVNRVVRVVVTASDVAHAFGVPAFGIIVSAIPGQENETWFKAATTGVFYGQCREMCGANHAFMPVEVHVVTDAEFKAWVASRGGVASVQTATLPAGRQSGFAQGPYA